MSGANAVWAWYRICWTRRIVVGGVLLLGSVADRGAAQVLETQAIPARPFGFAAVSFAVGAVPEGELPEFAVVEEEGRAYYPVFSAGRLARLLGDAGDAAGASGMRTALFLFTGTEPLQLTVHTPAPVTVTVRPVAAPPRILDRLRNRWWRDYHASAEERARRGDYPPLVETYLPGMLGQRLGLRVPLLSRLQQKSQSPLAQTMDLLFASESVYVEAMRRTMAGPRPPAVADQPVPPDIAWVPRQLPRGADADVEPMAQHVPEECFYVRFGTFENYLWLDDLLTFYGGDVGRMVSARGQNARVGDRIRQQLALPVSALARIFGGQLIADVAILGRDIYVQDGAAVGVLFHARNTGGLGLVLQQHRRTTATTEEKQGATLETTSIGGKNVSLLSTPDNRLRSFHVVDGDFHLVTTSRRIAERFLQAGQGLGPLGDSPEFQRARASFPLARNDTLFVFLSTSFLGGLMGPQYQLELQRRIQAVTDLELVQLARLAAAGERMPGDSIDALVAGGFLPTGFGRGPDGSGPILSQDRAIDSLRGGRGTFTPVPDIPLTAATSAEVAAYGERANWFARQWRQLDPLVVAVQRRTDPGGRAETLTVDANISPLAEEKYGWLLSILGPPVPQQIAPRAGDVISLQAYVTGGQLANTVPPHLLFVGVQDVLPVFQGSTNGIWQTLRLLRTTPGYLGAWPKPGFLDWLPLQSPPDVEGYSRLPLDLWRWQGGDFSVLSFHRDVLEQAVPQLRVEEGDAPAQIRLHVGDLAESRLRDWVNWMYFQRAQETSVANARLLHALHQQLHLPLTESLVTAEQLLDVQLLCPLGGKYELVTSPSGRSLWQSTAWKPAAPGGVPPDYRAPPLQWFRGLDLALTRSGDQVVVRVEARMEPPAPDKSSTTTLPLLDLFRKRSPE